MQRTYHAFCLLRFTNEYVAVVRVFVNGYVVAPPTKIVTNGSWAVCVQTGTILTHQEPVNSHGHFFVDGQFDNNGFPKIPKIA